MPPPQASLLVPYPYPLMLPLAVLEGGGVIPLTIRTHSMTLLVTLLVLGLVSAALGAMTLLGLYALTLFLPAGL